jgi:AcrR family transcriptional regulator
MSARPVVVEAEARPLRRDAAENRERVLDAAAAVFARDGLAASVEEIARMAGVGMGTLYRRFPTKEALIEELVRQQLTDLLDAASLAAATPEGKGLESFLWAAGHLLQARSGCLGRLWTEAGTAPLVEQLRMLIAELLQQGQVHGRIRSDIALPDITLLLWGLNGVISVSHAVAPTAWRRSLELSIAGLRPSSEALVHPILASHQMDAISRQRRLSEQPHG